MSDSDCTTCDKLLDKIKDIDSHVLNAEREKDYFRHRADYIRVSSVVKSTKDMIQQRYEEAFTNWICLKDKQKKRHLKLTKHYREYHLNE